MEKQENNGINNSNKTRMLQPETNRKKQTNEWKKIK